MDAVQLKVQYRTISGFMGCYEKYLSSRFRFLQSQKIMPVGARLEFEIHPPFDEKPFKVQGRVKSVIFYSGENGGMNIEYSFLNFDDAKRIKDFVRRMDRRRIPRHPIFAPPQQPSTHSPHRRAEDH